MILEFKKNQIIKIVPQDVDASCSLSVVDCCDEFLIVSRDTNCHREITGKVECFSMTEDGVIYFKSKISKINEEQYKLTLPITHNILQRREYTRIEFNSTISLISEDDKQVEATITDISAGGMKIISQQELSISNDYKFNLNLDKTQDIKAVFEPIRQDKNADGSYLTSGKFKMISNKDRILLAQFCFRKHMENNNK